MLAIRRSGDEGHLVESGVLSSRPVLVLPGVDIAAGHCVIHSANWAILGRRIMHGEEERAVLLCCVPVVKLRHFAIKIDQLCRFNARVGCLEIKLPADVVAFGLAVVAGLAAGMGKAVLASGREEPELRTGKY